MKHRVSKPTFLKSIFLASQRNVRLVGLCEDYLKESWKNSASLNYAHPNASTMENTKEKFELVLTFSGFTALQEDI